MVVGIVAALAVLYATWTFGPRTPGASASPPTSGEGSLPFDEPELDTPSDASAEPATSQGDAAPTRSTVSAAPGSSDGLRGSVHDRASGAPLYDFELSAWTYGLTSETAPHARTDAEGRFSFGGFPFDSEKPTVIVTLIDDPSVHRNNNGATEERRKLEIADASAPYSEPFRFDVEVGPTVGFEVEFPAGLGVSDFSVVLDSSPPSPGHWQGNLLRSALRAPLGYGPHATLPWVRFGEPTTIQDRAWVELRSNDKRWRGGAWLKQLEGVVETPLKIRLAPSTRLVGRFLWPTGVEENYAELALSELRADGTVGRGISGGAGDDGEFVFELLQPARYRLATKNAAWKPFALDVDVHPGENDIGSHVLEPRRVVGSLSGVIRSRSGRYEGACHASLSNTAFSHDATFDHSIDFEPLDESDPNSELVAHFEFEDVTEGEWLLYVHCHDGFEFPGSLTTVHAPANDLVVWLEDGACSARIEFVEAETGRPCENAELHWRCGDESDLERGAVAQIAGLPDDPKRFEWVASAPGRKALRGTGLDLARQALPEGSVQLVGVLRLEPGFGRLVSTHNRGDGAPLAGVEVRCDDLGVGITDAKGELMLVLDVAPNRITFAKSGWAHVSSRDFNAATGSFSDDAELRAYFEPERP